MCCTHEHTHVHTQKQHGCEQRALKFRGQSREYTHVHTHNCKQRTLNLEENNLSIKNTEVIHKIADVKKIMKPLT